MIIIKSQRSYFNTYSHSCKYKIEGFNFEHREKNTDYISHLPSQGRPVKPSSHEHVAEPAVPEHASFVSVNVQSFSSLKFGKDRLN